MRRILSRALAAGALAAGCMATSANAKVSVLIERDTPINSSLQAGFYEFASVDDYIAGTGATFRESAFLLSDYFSFGGLSITDDSGPAGAVPEPTTWALMILGFGLAGGAMRRRAPLRGR